MSTDCQIAANQANSLLSTGPSSDLGKQISSRNALKHGLSGKGLLPAEEQAAARKRTLELIESLKPADPFQHTLVEQIACEEVRAKCCAARVDAHRSRDAIRAIDFWPIDRRMAAEFIARGLHKKPEIVSRQLQCTKQGNELLIEYWQGLAGALYKNGDWDESQRSLALDLMGTPLVLRNGHTKLDTREGYTGPEWLAETVAYHISILEEQKPALEELDGYEQEMAICGLEPTPSAELKLLRRYESAALRRMQWAYKQLLDRQKGRKPRASRTERPAPTELTREELRARAKKEDEELDALRYQTWMMMQEAGVETKLCSQSVIRQLATQDIQAAQQPAAVAPPKPVSSSRPPQPFYGNRKERRAAAAEARRAKRS